MAGRDGARGYVYQALVAVFKCFRYDSWDQIKVEPLTNDDKVDILLKKDEVLIKAIQVKSSINKFKKPDIERWISEIKKDVEALDYDLVLIGDYLTKPASEFINKNNNDKSAHIHIEVIEGGEQGIKRLIKGYVLEFLECYNPDRSIVVNEIDDIANRIFAKLIVIGTNENWFSKSDLINEINKNISSNADKIKIWYSIKKVIFVLVCFSVFYFSIYVSKESFISRLCVVFSDVMIVIIWVLLKYSDIHFWRNLQRDIEYHSSRQYGSECRSIAVNIHKDSILNRQKVCLENLLDEKIDYIEGEIKFFSGKTQKNQVLFKKVDVDSGREVEIDEISYNMDREYCDKTSWDEVELHIYNIVSKDGRACPWSGTVIKFSRIYNFDQFNYLRVGEIKILPYEITWLKNRIVKTVCYWISVLMSARFFGWDRNNLWKHIKMQVIGFCNRLIRRIVGMLLFGLISIMALGVVYGQLYWMFKLLKYIFNACSITKNRIKSLGNTEFSHQR